MFKSLIYSHLYEWYEINHRNLPWRETDDPYCIWLSEIILQQTRVAQGLAYYRRFVDRWPTVEALASADEADVLREWQGLGYYSRARNLHKAAKQIVESQKSKVESSGKVEFPKTFEQIRALPGVGDYTAGAIASFAYNQPYPAVDGNVYRVVARLLDIDEPFDTSAGKKLFHKHIKDLLDQEHPRLFNSAIMEFGALQCTPVLGDNCVSCPLQNVCAGYAHGTASLLPVRKPRPKVKDRWLDYHVYISRKSKEEIYTLIRRREEKDIWYHLYEFPCEERDGEQNTEYSRQPSVVSHQFSLTHVLSHQKIHARFIVHKVDELPSISGAFCVSWQELDDFALSRLTLKALDRISPR
jgi:A/G-specific adenine glycosylase